MSQREKTFVMEMTVGFFVLVMLLSLAVFSIFISKKALFRDVYPVTVHFDNVSGLRDGDSVYYRGFLIGKVDDIVIEKDRGGVEVHLALEEPIPLYADYSVRIVTASALGGKQMNIEQGTEAAGLVAEGTVLTGEPPKDLIEEAVGAIDFVRKELEEGGMIRNFSQTASNLVAITHKINEGEGTIARLLNDSSMVDDAEAVAANLREISENFLGVSRNIKEGKGTVGRLLSEDETLYDDIALIAANLKDTSEKISGIVSRVDEGKGSLGKLLSEDDELYDNLLATSESVRSFTDKLNSGEGTLNKLITDDALYEEILSLVQEARSALDDLRETSPITTFGSLFFGAF